MPLSLPAKLFDSSNPKVDNSTLPNVTKIDSPKPLRNFLRLPLHLLQRPTATQSSNSIPADDPGPGQASKVSLARLKEVSSPESKMSSEETTGSLFGSLSSLFSFIDLPNLDFPEIDLPNFFSSGSLATTPASVVTNSTPQYHDTEQIPKPNQSISQAPVIRKSNNHKRHITEKSSSVDSLGFSRNKLVLLEDLPRGTIISVHKPSTFLSSLASGGPIVLDDETEIRNIDISSITEAQHPNPIYSDQVFTPLSYDTVQYPVSSLPHVALDGVASKTRNHVLIPSGFNTPNIPITSFPSYAELPVASTGPYPIGSPFAPSVPPQVGNTHHHVHSVPLPNEPQSYDVLPPSYEMVPPPPIPGYESQNRSNLQLQQQSTFEMESLENILKSIVCECENSEHGTPEGNCNCDEPHNLVLVFPPKPNKPYMFVPLKTIPEKLSSNSIPPVLFREHVIKGRGSLEADEEEELLDITAISADEVSAELKYATAFSAPQATINGLTPDTQESVLLTETESVYKVPISTQQNYRNSLSVGDLYDDQKLTPLLTSEANKPLVTHPYAPQVYPQPIPYLIHNRPVHGAVKPVHSQYKAAKSSWPSNSLFKSFIPFLTAPLKKAMKALSAFDDTSSESSEYIYAELPQPYAISGPHQQVYQTPLHPQQVYPAPLSIHPIYQDSVLVQQAYQQPIYHAQGDTGQDPYQQPVYHTHGDIGQEPYQPPVYHVQGDLGSTEHAPQDFTQQGYLYSDMLNQLQEIQKIIKQNYKISHPIQQEHEEHEIYSIPESPIQEYGLPAAEEDISYKEEPISDVSSLEVDSQDILLSDFFSRPVASLLIAENLSSGEVLPIENLSQDVLISEALSGVPPISTNHDIPQSYIAQQPKFSNIVSDNSFNPVPAVSTAQFILKPPSSSTLPKLNALGQSDLGSFTQYTLNTTRDQPVTLVEPLVSSHNQPLTSTLSQPINVGQPFLNTLLQSTENQFGNLPLTPSHQASHPSVPSTQSQRESTVSQNFPQINTSSRVVQSVSISSPSHTLSKPQESSHHTSLAQLLASSSSLASVSLPYSTRVTFSSRNSSVSSAESTLQSSSFPQS
ncbi:uncharacterized protein [Palaemon carinicauda]|uniref:uncharacterized protein n=1 Tax=Palaemon carinicauda TaxID=392227 RepID=UPI0035B57649